MTNRDSFVTLTLAVPDTLQGVDMLMLTKYAQAFGVTLVEFDWPRPPQAMHAAA